MNIDVTIFTGDELNCKVFSFWLDERTATLILSGFYIKSRETKRHHFKCLKSWSRIDGRYSNEERPVVSDDIKEKAIQVLLNHIKFE